jgi:hypothetical protein
MDERLRGLRHIFSIAPQERVHRRYSMRGARVGINQGVLLQAAASAVGCVEIGSGGTLTPCLHGIAAPLLTVPGARRPGRGQSLAPLKRPPAHGWVTLLGAV